MRNFLKKIAHYLNPVVLFGKLKLFIVNFPHTVVASKDAFINVLDFAILLFLYITNLIIKLLLRFNFIHYIIRDRLLKFTIKVRNLAEHFDIKDENGALMSRLDLFDLAFKNMGSKPSRTIITVGGMALGVATIIFLVTLGYGLQKLVIDKVARLDEMKQTDVSIQPGSNIMLTDDSLSDFKRIDSVEYVLPLIGLVGKVKYQGSVSDVAVYGVTTDYLKNSAIHPSEGKLFENNELRLSENSKALEVKSGEVAGAAEVRSLAKIGEKLGYVNFSIFPESWILVRESPMLTSKAIGYTKRVDSMQPGIEYLGDNYPNSDAGNYTKDSSNALLGKWIQSTVYIWIRQDCSLDNIDCVEGKYVRKRDTDNNLIQESGYFSEVEMVVESNKWANLSGDVLGISTDGVGSEESISETKDADETTSSSMQGDYSVDDLAFISSVVQTSASGGEQSDIKKVTLPDKASKVAVVNEAFLQVLGLNASDAIDKSFDVSFVVTSDLSGNETQNIVSEDATYKIVAVIPGTNNPFFYVQIADLKSLGVNNYSQVRVVSTTKENLQPVRTKIESMGFSTTSVADTITRINSLFGTIRIVLGLIGAVALSVAALGMFNTLTVSLLERTREIGLMKAMGMTSVEVKNLFLTESMMMGLMGGTFGIVVGYVAGKSLSLVLSIFGLIKGVGFIDVIYLPIGFALLVFCLSVFVGLVTGIYPSRRATKISALNALRYE